MKQTFPIRHARTWLLAAGILSFANAAVASTLTFGGTITQSTADGTGPAVNNPALQNIADGDLYMVRLGFVGPLWAPSPTPHDLTGSTLIFQDSTHPAVETNFGSISLTILSDGLYEDFSLLACLNSGISGCASGNQLTGNFKVLTSDLNSQNAAATGLDQPHPLDLLEDDGTTDIQGSITTYSLTSGSSNPTPEPSSWLLAVSALAVLSKLTRSSKNKENIS